MNHDVYAPKGVSGWRFLVPALAVCALLAVARADKAANAPASPPNDAVAERKLNGYAASEIAWKDGPATLPKGAKFAVLEGDPAKAGPFLLRLKVPAGYVIPPHTHPLVERATVISGTFKIGFGVKVDPASVTAFPAGSYLYWSPGMEHYAIFDEDTVLQLHGIGPWGITYVNPADDPRNKKLAAK